MPGLDLVQGIPPEDQPVTGPKDRWHQLADAISETNLPASDKAIFRYLLDKADWRTAELPARFTPLQQEIGRKTSHSPRQIRYSLTHLGQHGWLTTGRREDDKRRHTYALAYGWACDCPGRRHTAAKIAATETGDSGNHCRQIAATDSGNAAGKRPVLTERLREEGVREGPELCSIADFGPCTRCRASCIRYGEHGRPLCPDCTETLAYGRAS
jgi:hypothetical protein